MDTPVKALKRSHTRRNLAIGGAVLALAGAIWVFWPKPVDTRGVDAIAVQSGALTETIPMNAVLVPVRSSVISTPSGGTLVEVVAYPGQEVKQGDALFRLDNEDLAQQFAQAQSDLASASSDLVAQQADEVDQQSAVEMARNQAENDLRVARMQLEAERSLQKQGIISLLAMKKTEAETAGKQAQLEYAVKHSARARIAGHAKTNAVAQRLQVVKSRADHLQALVDALTMRAPFDGVVASVQGKQGGTVPAGGQLAELITRDFEVNFEIAEQFADRVKPGLPIELQGGLTGTITAIAPGADGGVVKGRAKLDKNQRGLRSNSALPGEIVLSRHGDGVFIVIDDASLAGQTVPGTVRGADGSLQRRTLHFGPAYGTKIVVESGAQPGEKLVDVGAE